MELNTVDIKTFSLYIIIIYNLKGLEINYNKLQKLLYAVQSLHIGNFKKHLLFDELPEAWPNGTVYRSIYEEYYNKSVDDPDLMLFLGDDEEMMCYYAKTIADNMNLPKHQLKFIEKTIIYLLQYTEIALTMYNLRDPALCSLRRGLSPIESCYEKLSVDLIYETYRSKKCD